MCRCEVCGEVNTKKECNTHRTGMRVLIQLKVHSCFLLWRCVWLGGEGEGGRGRERGGEAGDPLDQRELFPPKMGEREVCCYVTTLFSIG